MVMRDTGFGGAAVKADYVKQKDYLEEYEDVYLLDNSYRRFQKAVVDMSTTYFKGRLKVLVVDSLVVDCVIGNIKELSKKCDGYNCVDDRVQKETTTKTETYAYTPTSKITEVDRCAICKMVGHSKHECWFKNTDRRVKRCFNCGSGDHLRKDCWRIRAVVG